MTAEKYEASFLYILKYNQGLIVTKRYFASEHVLYASPSTTLFPASDFAGGAGFVGKNIDPKTFSAPPQGQPKFTPPPQKFSGESSDNFNAPASQIEG